MSDQKFSDDPSIEHSDELWRRIGRRQDQTIFDNNTNRYRPSSGAFNNNRDGSPMSVDLAKIAKFPSVTLKGHEDYNFASITAGLARDCNQIVAHDPQPDNPAHSVVVGKKSKSVRSRFAKGANWVLPPKV